ncbi:hypothetical protein EVAR_48754_1 [Eumeta japonica]|uniref:Uncharacterized protein n=1 Tax=Eumeta variegata TaxID=151549 RepID=A0A4C1YIG9_EUMVA|nr:hypothetical protein EVAR_48754_1 [Eumeta japonica]
MKRSTRQFTPTAAPGDCAGYVLALPTAANRYGLFVPGRNRPTTLKALALRSSLRECKLALIPAQEFQLRTNDKGAGVENE